MSLPPERLARFEREVDERLAAHLPEIIERLQAIARKDSKSGRWARRLLMKHGLPLEPPDDSESGKGTQGQASA